MSKPFNVVLERSAWNGLGGLPASACQRILRALIEIAEVACAAGLRGNAYDRTPLAARVEGHEVIYFVDHGLQHLAVVEVRGAQP